MLEIQVHSLLQNKPVNFNLCKYKDLHAEISNIVIVFTQKLINSVSSTNIIKLGYPAGGECGISKDNNFVMV